MTIGIRTSTTNNTTFTSSLPSTDAEQMSGEKSLEQQQDAMYARVLVKLEVLCAHWDHIFTSLSASPASITSPTSVGDVPNTTAATVHRLLGDYP